MASQGKIFSGIFVLFLAASFFLCATADPIPLPLGVVNAASLPAGTGISLLPCNTLSNSICCSYTPGTSNYIKCSLALLCNPTC